MSNNWIMLPLGLPQSTGTTITISVQLSPEDVRKSGVMQKLFQVGVIFRHKGSRVLWEVVELKKNDDGEIRYAILKSKNSGYKKWFSPDSNSYDNLDLYEAPEALKILFGDAKHVKSSLPPATGNPQKADEAFDIELSEDQIEQND